MQVDLALYGVAAAREAAHGSPADRRSLKMERIAVVLVDQAGVDGEGLAQHGGGVGTAESRARWRTRTVGRARLGIQPPRITHCAAKEFLVIVAHGDASSRLWKATVVEYSERLPGSQSQISLVT